MKIRSAMDWSERSAHDEIRQSLEILPMKAPSKDCNHSTRWSSLMICGVILIAMPLRTASAEPRDWQEVRDTFLKEDQELLKFHCDRGTKANQQSISAFNDAWVSNIQTLRIEAGVAPHRPDGSNPFFSGLSMAMKSRCPGVW